MPNKKDPDAEKTPAEKALEERIDAMLAPNRPDQPPAPKPAAPSPALSSNDKPLDIFAGKSAPVSIQVNHADEQSPEPAATAPELPGKSSKPAAAAVPKAAAGPAEPAPQDAPSPDPAADEAAPVSNVEDTSTKLDDNETDKAVDDIAATESDALLAAEDAAKAGQTATKKPTKRSRKFGKFDLKGVLKNKWTWVGLAVVILLVLAVPFTRYKVLGLAIKEPVTVLVMDSKTNTPVSNADVSLGGASAKTDADGKATLKAAVGSSQLQVTKQYYTTYSAKYTVSFKAASASAKLVATGRQVPITVLNKITGKPLSGAEIKVLATTAKTNSKGQATVVLPASAATDKAVVTLSGYNTANVAVQVTNNAVAANMFQLTPSGHIYFLSNLSGTIDVVKTNLDGSGRKTVFAGTGKEDPNTTTLLASRDWRYLVLKSQHDSAQASLYIIDTSNDSVTSFDSSNADFSLIGWVGHTFLYDIQSNTIPQSQAGHEIIKGYNADTQQLNQYDQNQAEGTTGNYGYQTFSNFYILNNELTYTTQWYSVGGYDISTKSDTIRAVQPGVQNKKDYQSEPTANVLYIQAALYEPQAVYYGFYNNNTNQTTFYTFENQSVSTSSSVTQDDLNKGYPTFLLSPSGNHTFWTELRDGKNTLFTGDADAQNSKQIASLSDYSPYGWFTDNYVLVSKNGSELYIMPAGSTAAQPLKITDYYKPAQSYNGYGYGYGGL